MIDYRLQTFLTVCHLKSYTAAAKTLHITQPAVSGHIKHLEQIYNVKLFTITGKTLSLTREGILLKQRAETVISDDKVFRTKLIHTGDKALTLTLGVTATIGSFAIAKPLSLFLSSNKKYNINLVVSNTRSLLEKLKNGEIDFAILEGSFNNDEVSFVTLRNEPFIAVSSSKHKFSKEIIGLHDLLGEHLLVREKGSGTRRILEESLSLRGLSLENFSNLTTIGSMTVLIDLILYDSGISFIYKLAAEPYLKDGSLKNIPLKDLHITHPFTGIWAKNSSYGDLYKSILVSLMSPKK